MACFQKTLHFQSETENQMLDVTAEIREAVKESGVREGLCSVFTPHATAAIAINENADPNIGEDFLTALKKAIPDKGNWLHDKVDRNAAAHIKSAIVGPSESIPIADGELQIGSWQNIFLCEFDGPRSSRRVIVTIVS